MGALDSFTDPVGSEDRRFDGGLDDLVKDFLEATDRSNGVNLIRGRSPEALFKPSELRILDEELGRLPETPARIDQSQATVVIKATRLCNLRCSYCNSWREGPGNVISFRTILRRTLEAINGMATDAVHFVWHGGEMTLLGPSILEKMVWVQERYRPRSLIVSNSLQTNGFAMTDEWLAVLERTPIAVGISIDGPREIHDRYRRTRDGNGSYDSVLATISNLNSRGIPVGALIVVGRSTLDMPIPDYLDWLIESGIHFIDFLNVAPCDDDLQAGVPDEEFVPVDEFVLWLTSVEEHIRRRRRWQPIRIRLVEEIRRALEESSALSGCYFSGDCFSSVVTLNPSGTLSPCDKYVTNKSPAMTQPFQTPIAAATSNLSMLHDSCGSQNWVLEDGCKWRHLCKGGCPHDSQALSIRKGSKLACCGFAPLFDQLASTLVEG